MSLKGRCLILPSSLDIPLLSTRLGLADRPHKEKGRRLHGGSFRVEDDNGRTLLLRWTSPGQRNNPVLWEIPRASVV